MPRSIRVVYSAVAAIALLLPPSATAQTGRIGGIVFDATTQQPIEGVQVIVQGTSYGSVTKANGSFVILAVPPGTYVIEARRIGYTPFQFTNVNVTGDVTRTLNFTLGRAGSTSSAQMGPIVEQGTVGAVGNARHFPLQYLSNNDAASLVAPFAEAAGGHVFGAGAGVRGITVRGAPSTLATIDSLLKENDRPPVTLLFRFDVIAALDSNVRDPQISADVATALRESFPYAGYRLISQSTITNTQGQFSSVMVGGNDRFNLQGYVESVISQVTLANGNPRAASRETRSVSLQVQLSGPVENANAAITTIAPLITTSLRAPINQVVILGSASNSPSRRALILVLRPTVVEERRE